jgi:phosphatidylinositol-3-phosphatase
VTAAHCQPFSGISAGATFAIGALVATTAFAQVPRFDHVVVVVMENHSYDDIIGNVSEAPYINALAAQGASFSNAFAIEHPSEPNYLDLFSGSNQGVTDDSCPHTFSNAANLGSQVFAAGFTFVGYAEDLPANKPKTCTSGNYARKHNPWVNFPNLPGSSNQPYSAFPVDFTTLPTLALVVPNLCNDMHNCSIATGDGWLETHIDAYVQWAPLHNSLLVLTWDEDDYSQSNQVPTIFVGASVIPGDYAEHIDHFSVLATLESIYGLTPLGGAASARAIADVWDTTIFASGFD